MIGPPKSPPYWLAFANDLGVPLALLTKLLAFSALPSQKYFRSPWNWLVPLRVVMLTFDPASPLNCPPYPFVTTLTSCTSFCPNDRFVAPELFRFRYGSLSSIPFTAKRFLVAEIPLAPKSPHPPALSPTFPVPTPP